MSIKTIAIIIVIVAIMGGAWYYLSVAHPSSTGPTNKEFILRVEKRKLVEGPATLSAQQGDTVTIKITADEDEELHVHGYDRSVDLESGTEASLSFVADQTGRFPYELEHSKTEIGALEVYPR